MLLLGQVIRKKWTEDLNSSWFIKNESDGTYMACSHSNPEAKNISSDRLPKDSLRGHPIKFDDLKKRFNSPIRLLEKEDIEILEEFKAKVDDCLE